MKLISEIKAEPILGIETIDLFKVNQPSKSIAEFIRIKNAITYVPIVNLKVESDYSPTFKQSEVMDGKVIVGYGNRFAIFDLTTKKVQVELLIEGYFGSFTLDKAEVFVATDSELINIEFTGVQKWKTSNLGIDGVLISKITETEIIGSGEWDPPGGWESFRLDRNTGLEIDP